MAITQGTLAGYDEVFALSQNTINSTFRRLYRRGIITINLPPAFQNVVINPPRIDLGRRANGPAKLTYFLSFKSGQYNEFDLSNMEVVLNVTTKSDVWDNVPPEGPKMTSASFQELKARAGAASNNFSINVISIHFDPATVEQTAAWTTTSRLAPPQALRDIKEYFKSLSLGDHGYHLGYSFQSVTGAFSVFGPTAAKAGFNLYSPPSGTVDQTGGLNTFMFNLQTARKALPNDPQAGIFNTNLIADNLHGGVFMFSNVKFADEWVNNVLINQAILPALQSRPTGAVFKKRTPTSWEFYDNFAAPTFVHKNQGNTNQRVHQDMNQIRRCWVNIFGRPNQIQVNVNLYLQRDFKWALEIQVDPLHVFGDSNPTEALGSAKSVYESNMTFTLSPNTTGGLDAQIQPPDIRGPTTETKKAKNGHEFLTFFTNINPGKIMNEDTKYWSNETQKQMGKMATALKDQINAVAASVLIPGTTSYSFSNLRLSPEAHVIMDIDYQDDDTPVQKALDQQMIIPKDPIQPVEPPSEPDESPKQSFEGFKISARSDLIEQHVAGQLIGRREGISAVADANGNPVIFATSDSGQLEMIKIGTATVNGWSVFTITPPGATEVQEAAAYEGADGMIYIAAAVASTVGGQPLKHSRVFVAVVRWSELESTDWAHVWVERQMPFGNQSTTVIGKFLWGGATALEPQPILLASSLGSKTGDGWNNFAQHYRIDISPKNTDPSKIWTVVPMPLNSTNIRSIALGVDAIGDKGVYCLFDTISSVQLYFTSFSDEYGKSSQQPIDCRTGDLTLLSIPRLDGKTTLFVGGSQGIFCYGIGRQSKGHNPVSIASASEISAPIADLEGHVTEDYTSIWALDRSSNLLHITGRASAGAPIDDSWGYPLLKNSGIASFDPIYNHQKHVDELILLSNSQQESLTHIYRTSPTGSWVSLDIPIPSVDKVLAKSTYTTVVKVLNKDGNPAPLVPVHISAAERQFVIVNDMYIQIDNTPSVLLTDYNGLIKIVLATTSLQAPTYTLVMDGVPMQSHDPTQKVTNALKKYSTLDEFKNAKKQDGRPVFDGSENHEDVAAAFEVVQKMGDIQATLDTGATKSRVTTKAVATMGPMTSRDVNAFNGPLATRTSATSLISMKSIEGLYGDVIEHAKVQWDIFTEGVKTSTLEIIDGVVQVVVRYGNAFVNMVLTRWDEVYQYLSWRFEQLKQVIKDLREWLGFLFDWGDMKHTQKHVALLVNSVLQNVESKIPALKQPIQNQFHNARVSINKNIMPPGIGEADEESSGGDSNINKVTDFELPGIPSEISDLLSKVTDNPFMDWINDAMNKVVAYINEHVDLFPDLDKYFSGGLEDVVQNLLSGVNKLDMENSEFLASLKELAKQKKPSLISLLRLIAGTLFKDGLHVVEALTLSLVDVSALIVGMIRDILNHEMKIPLLTWLWDQIFPDTPFTILNIFALFMAIPTTIVCKLLTGKRPFDGINGTNHPFLTASVATSSGASITQSAGNNAPGAADDTKSPPSEALTDFISIPPMWGGAAEWTADKGNNWVYVKNSMSITARILNEISARLSAVQQLMDASAKRAEQRKAEKKGDPPPSPVDKPDNEGFEVEPIFELTSYADSALSVMQLLGGTIGCFGQFSSLISAFPLANPSYAYNGLDIHEQSDRVKNQWTQHAEIKWVADNLSLTQNAVKTTIASVNLCMDIHTSRKPDSWLRDKKFRKGWRYFRGTMNILCAAISITGDGCFMGAEIPAWKKFAKGDYIGAHEKTTSIESPTDEQKLDASRKEAAQEADRELARKTIKSDGVYFAGNTVVNASNIVIAAAAFDPVQKNPYVWAGVVAAGLVTMGVGDAVLITARSMAIEDKKKHLEQRGAAEAS